MNQPDRISSLRVFSGGVLMGLANLVPGVSGGTMILALGLYDRFIASVADVTRLKPTAGNLVFLGTVAFGAVLSIAGFAGLMVGLIAEHRWIMYSLFIGMTLGGVPELVRLSRPLGLSVFVSVALGVATMAMLAFGLSTTTLPHTALVFGLIGALAASSMILPGVSGSYILLIFGLYDVVVGSASVSELRADPAACLAILVPVGIGAALGIGLLSNLLKSVLARFPRPSHGLLLGLLLGSVLGLWPFQEPVRPELSDKSTRKAIAMLVAGATEGEIREEHGVVFAPDEATRFRADFGGMSGGELKLEATKLQRFTPGAVQSALSLGLLVLGFLLTRALQVRESG